MCTHVQERKADFSYETNWHPHQCGGGQTRTNHPRRTSTRTCVRTRVRTRVLRGAFSVKVSNTLKLQSPGALAIAIQLIESNCKLIIN